MQKILFLPYIALTLLSGAGCAGKSPASDCIDPEKINTDAICTAIYQPVCGCDNKTYGNECEARRSGITSFTPGECP